MIRFQCCRKAFIWGVVAFRRVVKGSIRVFEVSGRPFCVFYETSVRASSGLSETVDRIGLGVRAC